MGKRLPVAVASVVLLVAASSCGEEGPSAPTAVVAYDDQSEVAPVEDESLPKFAATTRSLRLRRSIAVREEPDADSSPLGTIAQDMRVGWRGAALGPGCDGLWIAIEPRGFVCDRHLEENFREPRTLELPRLPEGELVPGEFGAVSVRRAHAFRTPHQARRGRGGRRLSGQVAVKKLREVNVGPRTFWRVGSGELIDARHIRSYEPSVFQGVDLQDEGAPSLPFAWIRDPRPEDVMVPVLGAPDLCDEPIGHLPPRLVVPVLERSSGGSVRIGDAAWVSSAHLHIAWPTHRPDGVGALDRWMDVDLEDQVLVAYVGKTPVMATLISSGGPASPTPEGEFRIWIKFAERDMRGEVRGRPYLVERVPWAAFFHGDFGFHAAYWHDDFGRARSSGCINLSPLDARRLYFWSQPEVPPGWTMAYDSEETPGSVIRIRRGTSAAELWAHRTF